MTSIANHNDVAYWDYNGGRQFVASFGIMSHQLKDIPMVQHALKNLYLMVILNGDVLNISSLS